MEQTYPISLKQLQIVAGALLMAQVTFMLIASFVALGGFMQPQPSLGLILLIALGAMMITGSVAAFVVRSAIIKAAAAAWRNRIDDDHGLEAIFIHFSRLTIITAALVEGIGLFGSLTVLIAGEWLALIAPILTIALAIGIFPNNVRWGEFHDLVTRA